MTLRKTCIIHGLQRSDVSVNRFRDQSGHTLTSPRFCYRFYAKFDVHFFIFLSITPPPLFLRSPDLDTFALRSSTVLIGILVKFQGTVDYIFFGPGPSSEEESRFASGNEGSGKSSDNLKSSMAGEALLPQGGDERSDCLRCLGVAEPPLRSDLDRFGGLPSPEEPSDHVLLAACFEVAFP